MRRGHEQSPCGLLMVQRPRGTRDFTPQVMNRRLAFEQLLENCARASGFNRVQTPILNRLTYSPQNQVQE